MLIHPTVERLRSLGLAAMADTLVELQNNPEAAEMSHVDWLGLLIDREATFRDNRRLSRRLTAAKLRQTEKDDLRRAPGRGRQRGATLVYRGRRNRRGRLCCRGRKPIRTSLFRLRLAAPDASYLFKHALVQDAAYGTLGTPCRNSNPAAIRRSSADPNSISGLRTTAASRACENSRPIAAPICASSFAGHSRVGPSHQC